MSINNSSIYQVIYDIDKQEYQYFNGDLIVPIILLIAIVSTIIFIIDRYKNKKKQSAYRGIIFIAFLSYMFKNFSMLYFHEFQRLNTLQLKENKSQKVVGNIKNFIQLSSNHKQPCSFEVNGVKFKFSPSARTGALTYISYPLKNRQKVRVNYIYDDNWKMNLILKLEVLK
jgi:hypothetical protein